MPRPFQQADPWKFHRIRGIYFTFLALFSILEMKDVFLKQESDNVNNGYAVAILFQDIVVGQLLAKIFTLAF